MRCLPASPHHCALQEEQTTRQMATEVCGFIAIIIGTFLLHATRDLDITIQVWV